MIILQSRVTKHSLVTQNLYQTMNKYCDKRDNCGKCGKRDNCDNCDKCDKCDKHLKNQSLANFPSSNTENIVDSVTKCLTKPLDRNTALWVGRGQFPLP